MAQELITVDFARQQITAAESIGEVKGIYDKLEALKRYAKSSRRDWDEQSAIAEASVWAAWKGGRLLRETERHPPGPSARDMSHDVTHPPPTLEQLHLNRMMAHRWRVISDCPEDELKGYCSEQKQQHKLIKSIDVYRLSKHESPPEEEEDEEQYDEPTDEEARRVAFLIRAGEALRYAVYDGPPDAELAKAAHQTAEAWMNLATQLEE